MQIKTIRGYHLTPVRMAFIKKSTNKCWRECREKGILLHCWWQCKLVEPLWRTVWRFIKILKTELPYDPAIPLLGIYPEKIIIQKDTYTTFPGGLGDKETTCNAGDPGGSLDREDPLEKEMATHSSILAWRLSRTEEPGRLQPMGSQRVEHDWATNTFIFSVQHSSVTQSCLTLCDPMNQSMPGLPVHHQLLWSTQTHVHWVSDAIQPSHPLSTPSPPALNLSQNQALFKWVSSSHQVAKVLEF